MNEGETNSDASGRPAPPGCGTIPRTGAGPAPRRSGRAERSAAALYMLLFAAAFCASRSIEPSPSGVGSHTQLGLPPCGFYAATGIPCLSCGMTTAFAHMARGSIAAGFAAQPFAAALFAAGAAAWLACGWSLIAGFGFFSWLERRAWKYWGVAIGAAAVAAWIYKIVATRRDLI